MKNVLSILSLILFLSTYSYAEEIIRGREANAIIKNAELIRYKDDVKIPSFVRLTKNSGPTLSELNSWIKEHFAGDENYTSEILSSQEDELGFTHVKLQQRVNGIPVEMSIIIAHFRNGRLQSINGSASINSIPGSYLYSENQSLESALSQIDAETYKWEVTVEEDFIKRSTGNPSATYYPSGKKVYFPKTTDFSSNELVPCYKFNIYAHDPLYRAEVYVSALDGSILFEDHQIKHADSAGTALTAYSGSRPIVSDYNTSSFRLRETARGNGIETYDMLNGNSYGSAVDFTNPNNLWPDTLRLRYATDAHWGAETVYDYFFNIHNRNSIDGLGFKLISYVHYNVNYANAFWNGQYMTYGDGNSNWSALTALDICAHEVSHGLTSNTAGLIYSYESGALNESFSDIFGCTVEYFAKPDPVDNWLMGEEIGSHLRNLGDPKQKGDPDTYLGVNWATGPADNGGVHTNSGVQNHWFYLLTLGGNGVNDNNDTFNVAGIGMAKSEAIAFRNLTVYLNQNSQYADARFYALEAAADLYGECSQEYNSTGDAWHAVGVGSVHVYNPLVVSNFTLDRAEFCTIPVQVNFKNLSNVSAESYIWDFGDGDSSIQKNPSHLYSNDGAYTVVLEASSRSCGNDSKIENELIIVNPDPSVTTSDVISCEGYPAKLTANASNTIYWYRDSLGSDSIFTGSPFVTNTLNTDTTFYVQNVIPDTDKKLGPDTIASPPQSFNGLEYQIFDVFEYTNLKSVKVFANGTKIRRVELRDSVGRLLQSKMAVINDGPQVIDLDFKLAPGHNYRLGVATTFNPDLFGFSTGASYPYSINGVASITGSSALTNPADHYFFFFDWIIRADDCKSEITPVQVTMDRDPDCQPFWSGVEQNDGGLAFDVYPNPANNSFSLSFSLSQSQVVIVELIDANGKKVKVLADSKFQAGKHTLNVSSDNLQRGLYLVRLSTSKEFALKKLLLVE